MAITPAQWESLIENIRVLFLQGKKPSEIASILNQKESFIKWVLHENEYFNN